MGVRCCILEWKKSRISCPEDLGFILSNSTAVFARLLALYLYLSVDVLVQNDEIGHDGGNAGLSSIIAGS